MKRTHEVMFVDWLHVDKGTVEVTLDPSRLSETGKETIEKNKRDWGIVVDTSGHGMKRSRIPYGVDIAVEKAVKSEPWLFEDQPWEELINWLTVLKDEGRFRCWYEVRLAPGYAPAGKPKQETGHVLCYAESDDGYCWSKPCLGLTDLNGSRENNVVSLYGNSTAVFRDDSAVSGERYKCFDWDKLANAPEDAGSGSKYGLYGCVSADGYQWERLPEPVVRYFCDTQNVACWDPVANKYVGYFRTHVGGRAIARRESDDFRTWSRARTVLCPGPEDAPSDDYYTNGFTVYPDDPSLKFMFGAVYHHGGDFTDIRLAVSHDGEVFNWVSHDPIIEVGAPGEWDCGGLYACPNLIFMPNGKLALPYHGLCYTHNEDYRPYYREYSECRTAYAWAVWDEGRLAGIEARSLGEFFTLGSPFEGNSIEINARTTRAGSVEVELWESESDFFSRPLEGYTFENSIPFRGDEICAQLKWKGKNDLSELRGKRIQLRIRLSDAKIFGFRFLGNEKTTGGPV